MVAITVPPQVAEAIREGHEIPDPKLAALGAFTSAMLATRGLPAKADVQAFLDAGYEERVVLTWHARRLSWPSA